MKGCLAAGIALFILVAIGIYSAFPHPTYDQSQLKAIAAESRKLIKEYLPDSAAQSVAVPEDKWPAVIRSLEPFSVTVRPGMVDITTKPFLDGGWGYGFATDRQNLTMLVECWSELGHDLYWHGPC